MTIIDWPSSPRCILSWQVLMPFSCRRLKGSSHEPTADYSLLVATCRSSAERTAREVLDVVPRIVGPGPLCWDRRLSRHLADLQVYIRQHHAEADLAALGSVFLAVVIKRHDRRTRERRLNQGGRTPGFEIIRPGRAMMRLS